MGKKGAKTAVPKQCARSKRAPGRTEEQVATPPRKSARSSAGAAESLAKHSARGRQITKRECVICTEEKTLGQFPGKITQVCEHERDVCRKCMARTIDLEVNGKGNSTQIRCPHPQCEGELEHMDMKREARKKDFGRYDGLLFQKYLQSLPGFRWCAFPGCGSGQIVSDIQDESNTGRNTFLRCHHCEQRSCAHHRCLWHNERTCDQYDHDAQNSEEVGLIQYLEREDVKRCPKCHHGIEKNQGCDHMTCSKRAGGCGAEFCFRCLADFQGASGIWKRGNSAHKKSCPSYFANPESEGDSDESAGSEEDSDE